MKEKMRFLLVAGIVPIAATATAESFSDHLYLTGDIGPAFEQTLHIRGADNITFNTGVRGDIAAGYQANSWFAAELATGVIWNSGDKIGGVPFSSFGAGLDLYQIPLLGNVILSTPVWHGFKPYIGGGLGCVFGGLDFQRPLGAIRNTDLTFGYQAMAGINYEISRNIELGLGYKYLETGEHDWAQNSVTLKTEATVTHSVTASFTWKF
jgi:opacity protein-like surface antigen